MPQQHRECGDHHPRGALAGDAACEPHSRRAFGGIETQGKNPRQRSRDTRDIRRADVAAARLAHVAAAK